MYQQAPAARWVDPTNERRFAAKTRGLTEADQQRLLRGKQGELTTDVTSREMAMLLPGSGWAGRENPSTLQEVC